MMSVPPPMHLSRLAHEAFPSMALLAGVELDVFTPLVEPMTYQEVAAKLGLDPDRLRPLLYALVDAKCLELDGERFRNTAESNIYLDRNKPTYIGDIRGYLRVAYSAGLKTASSIRNATPEAHWMSLPEEVRRDFLNALRVTAQWTVAALLGRFKLPASGKFADVGGGTGVVALALTTVRPDLHGTVIEHPEQVPMTNERIAQLGAQERVDATAADILTGPLTGSYDFAIMRAVLQMFVPDDAIRVLRNVRDILVPDGQAFIAYEVLDDSRLTPASAVRYNLCHAALFDHGRAYTESEYRSWYEAAGFVDVERFTLPNGHSVMRARRAP